MFQILEIQKKAAALTFQQECLAVAGKEEPGAAAEIFLLRDLSAVLIAEPAISISGILITELAKKNIPLIFCDKRHLPAASLSALNITGCGKEQLIRTQCGISKPFLKQCWKKLIRTKIHGQAAVLKQWRDSCLLDPLPDLIKLSNIDTIESRAAVIYWKKLAIFSKRDRTAMDGNQFFNYAYTILYAAFAREIAAAGLLPRFGIHHHHRDNPYCLASDLMEPFRPWIDSILIQCMLDLQLQPEQTISPAFKNTLLKYIYAAKCRSGNKNISLFSACRVSVASYKQALIAADHKIFKTLHWEVNDHVARCFF